jgi:hypothetical protein
VVVGPGFPLSGVLKKVPVGDEGNEMVGGAHPTSLARLGLVGWALPTTRRGNGIPGLFNTPFRGNDVGETHAYPAQELIVSGPKTIRKISVIIFLNRCKKARPICTDESGGV